MLPACTATRTFPAEPHDIAAPAGAIPSSYLWDSDADLASGVFYNTRVVSGTGRITLAQTPVWSPNVRVDDAPSGKQFSPSLAVGPDGTLYAAWADSRDCNYDLFRIRNDAFRDCNRDIYAAQYSERYGRYTAAPVDAGAHVVWGTLAYTATVPAGTGITLTVRVGNSPMPDARWSAWVTLGGSLADLSALPPARYFQWKASLTTSVSTTTPALEAVRLTWGAFNCANVSGILNSNTTWSAANSPYCVTGNVLVDTGVTLTVEPGVTVYISDTRSSIQVQGTLVALGTEAQPIRLTSWHPQGQFEDWGGIMFRDTAVGATFDAQGNYLGGSAFRYVTVEYAGYGSQGYAIDAPNTALYLNHCTVRHNGVGGVHVGGSSNRILNSLFSANSGGGVHNSGSNVTISGNVFSGNAFPGDLDFFGGGVYNAGSNVIVSGNIFSANSASYGGAIWWSGSGGILYNTIVGNTSSLGRGGIYLDSGFPVIRLNALVGNGGYALYNNNGGTTHVDARYNWWGTTDDGTIQGLICDWFDDGNKTIVDYAPYLTTLTADLSTPAK